MGCASSKRVDVATDVYRPPPSSFAVFDILSIEEPWLKSTTTVDDGGADDEKDEPGTKHVSNRLLEKLNSIEDPSRTWEEVSKALEEIKPSLNTPIAPPPVPAPAQDSVAANAQVSVLHSKSSLRTVEHLNEVKAVSPAKTQLLNSSKPESAGSGSTGGSTKSVKENIFILRDRLEREKEGKAALFVKRDPLSDYPEICPPGGGGSESVVLYTTSLGGVRRTFDNCNKLRSILEYHRVVFDERDVSLHGKFRIELRELLGESATVPRMFVKGRYMGGVDEVVGLNETGRLGRLLSFARVERGVGRLGCEGCGGARFVPCLDCGGSCKVVVGTEKERCPSCNENGLVHCPACSCG